MDPDDLRRQLIESKLASDSSSMPRAVGLAGGLQRGPLLQQRSGPLDHPRLPHSLDDISFDRDGGDRALLGGAPGCSPVGNVLPAHHCIPCPHLRALGCARSCE